MLSIPKISVVTPSFNSVNTIRETIESVLQQKDPNFEHIIMDGGSSDGTLDILREYPQLLWWSERDEGHYHAMNKGVQKATGDFVVILNADDCHRPGAFAAVREAFERHPDWDGLFGDAVYVDGAGKEIYRRKEAVFDYDVLRFCFDYVCHHTLFVKNIVYEQTGGYRYTRFKNCCDYDFVLRLAKGGYRIGKIPFFLVDYRYHEFGQSLDKRIVENTDRESRVLRQEHGCPRGWLGRVFYFYGHARRQMQKLLVRGTCDIIPARWILRHYWREKTTFSSNIGLDKL